MINAGAMMASSLVKMDVSDWERHDYIVPLGREAAAGCRGSGSGDLSSIQCAAAAFRACWDFLTMSSAFFRVV